MTAPRTLLQMAGAPLAPSPWAEAALVIIDAQMEYVNGGLPLPDAKPALAALARVLDLARQQGAPVIHVVHHGRPGGALFDPDGAFARIAPEAAPKDGEPIIAKSLPNAFAKTTLQATIAATGRKELVAVGFMTHMCVSATVRAALDLGYRTTIVADAAATRDLPDPLGGIAPAQTVHRATLAALADRFAIVVRNAGAWGKS
ncbi:MAG: cysteine hydrolase [Rhodospirillales bacterium]|nr:cysteine hydrolase [Rhodospirillales bacterium]